MQQIVQHIICLWHFPSKRVWRYQRGNHNPYIEEEQTTQWPKWKVQKDKRTNNDLQKHAYKTKNWVTRTHTTKNRGERRCSGRVSSSCSTSGTRRVNLVTNPVISREWGNDWEVLTTSGTYPWSFISQIFHNGQPSHGGDRKVFDSKTNKKKMIKSLNITVTITYGVRLEKDWKIPQR